MEVTPLGMASAVKTEQPENAPYSIVRRLEGKETDERAAHEEKARAPMAVTPSVIVALVAVAGQAISRVKLLSYSNPSFDE